MRIVDGVLRLLVIFAIGAVLLGMWRNPEGVRAAGAAVNDILKTGYAAASGGSGGGGGGRRRGRRG